MHTHTDLKSPVLGVWEETGSPEENRWLFLRKHNSKECEHSRLLIHSEDTLSGGGLGVLAGGRGRLHLLSVGELREEPGLEVLPPLVLLPTVDEHLVLEEEETLTQGHSTSHCPCFMNYGRIDSVIS